MKTITSNNVSTVLPHRSDIEQRSNNVQPKTQNTYQFCLICLAELQILTINDLKSKGKNDIYHVIKHHNI